MKNKRGFSQETNEFTPEQLDKLRQIAESTNTIKVVEVKKEIVKDYTKTKSLYPLKGIYLLEFEDGLKIGMSENIQRRLKDYKKPWCKPILNQVFFYCEYFQELEIEVLRKCKKYKESNIGSSEWITGISFADMTVNIDKIAMLRSCQNSTFKRFVEEGL